MSEPSRAQRLPFVTAALVAAALFASFEPLPSTLRDSLVLEREAVLHGALWQLLSSHLIHDHAALAFWDLGAIALLGAWLEPIRRAAVVAALALAAPLSTLAVVAFRPDLASYRGASALGSALFALGALQLARRSAERGLQVMGALALAAFAVKVSLESYGVWPSPALAGAPELESVALAHGVGGAAGGLVALISRGASSVRGRLVDCSDVPLSIEFHFERQDIEHLPAC